MNKKLITLAVAAAMVAPAAALAEATLYGTLHQSVDYISQDDIKIPGPGSGHRRNRSLEKIDGSDRLETVSSHRRPRSSVGNGPVGPSNRIGVKGSEDLGNGLKAIYQVELGVRLADGDYGATNGDRGSRHQHA